MVHSRLKSGCRFKLIAARRACNSDPALPGGDSQLFSAGRAGDDDVYDGTLQRVALALRF